jgi:hypothetical protein
MGEWQFFRLMNAFVDFSCACFFLLSGGLNKY